MTEAERRLWADKCSELLYRVLVEIRALSWEPGNEKRIEELADITHNVPHFLAGRDDHVPNYLRSEFVRYASKYWPATDPANNVYVELLDMDEAAFAENYRRTSWPWPQPATATAG